MYRYVTGMPLWRRACLKHELVDGKGQREYLTRAEQDDR